MVNSAVSSRFIDVMGRKEGFQTAQTLTGFKWIGNKMLDFEKEGVDAVLGYEEAIGYCCNAKIIVDKDGISACSVVAELAALQYAQGKTMKMLLEEIYEKYGRAVSNNSYLLCYDPPTITRIFDRLRSGGKGTPLTAKYGDDYIRTVTNPRTGHAFEITHVRDLHTGYESKEEGIPSSSLPQQPDAEMLTYTFANGAVLTIRTSGTEPKIKYYSELTGDNKHKEQVKEELTDLVEAVVATCLEPEKNNLKPPVIQ